MGGDFCILFFILFSGEALTFCSECLRMLCYMSPKIIIIIFPFCVKNKDEVVWEHSGVLYGD